ncbi:uncharacterized protein LALA0_S13e02982g [Lachancea lanzarotensis]|uniref:LALA0S13e02982g1_1 n=1 Tax=Lachancea lanzarotensis TaxID=1245769 RepID=A0A0C7NA95_9SACH|nr:uncharacterized protein LALA0_S13e02982g [Lachancea lanzarotensis]CEP64786.1 LALA0S13e02982g1_1 [Lachancea lanzarotensis]
MKYVSIYFYILFTFACAFQTQDDDCDVPFPWTAMSGMEWKIKSQGSETALNFDLSAAIPPAWVKSVDDAITKMEMHLLRLYALDSNVGIAEQIYTQCQSVKSSSNDLVLGLEGDEWGPVHHHLDQIIKKAIRNLEADFDVAFTDATTSATKLVQNSKKLTTALKEISVLVDNKFSPVTPNYTPDLHEFAHSIDELEVGRIIAEGIAKKIEQMVVGGDLHAAITEIANIFGDLGVLLTAYATGLAICAGNVIFVLCGVSILVCGGGTVIFICRLLQHLNNIYKVLGV